MLPPTMLHRLLKGSIVVLLLAGSGQAAAGESRIELSDGSVIAGEVVAVEGGHYRIRSAALG